MKWFNNVSAYQLNQCNWSTNFMNEKMAAKRFAPCDGLSMQSSGWLQNEASGDYVRTVQNVTMFTLCVEKKIIPSSVVNRLTDERCVELEEQQGFAVGRRQRRDVKSIITDEITPKLFGQRSHTRVCLDRRSGLLLIDSASFSRSDEVFRILLLTFGELPVTMVRFNMAPRDAMTNWLATDEAPRNFTIDSDVEFRANGVGKSTVKYVRHTLEFEHMRRHIAEGKSCTRLAMTWNDRVSFVLNESGILSRVTPLDVLQESASDAEDQDERHEADMLLMANEYSYMHLDLVEALGGIYSC